MCFDTDTQTPTYPSVPRRTWWKHRWSAGEDRRPGAEFSSGGGGSSSSFTISCRFPLPKWFRVGRCCKQRFLERWREDEGDRAGRGIPTPADRKGGPSPGLSLLVMYALVAASGHKHKGQRCLAKLERSRCGLGRSLYGWPGRHGNADGWVDG